MSSKKMTAAEWRAAAEENSRFAASQADELLARAARQSAAHCNAQADRAGRGGEGGS